jgi:thiol:disulfide interchange protein DsbD
MNFKKLFCLLAILVSGFLQAEIADPVHWKYSAKKTADNEYDLIFKAAIDKGWHMYSQFLESDNGPVATTFNFEKNKDITLVGKTKESASKSEYDKNFEMNVKYFENEVTFTQHIKLNKEGKLKVIGYLNFMTCEEGRCLPPKDVDFTFEVEGVKVQSSMLEVQSAELKKDSSIAETTIKEVEKKATVVGQTVSTAAIPEGPQSGWQIFLLGLLAGFTALLTPCVFPMIPMNVSFFTKQSKTKAEGIKNASIFSLSIIILYVSLGLLFTIAFGLDSLHDI